VPNRLIGASVWESELYEHLTSHAEVEMELLEPYRQAAAESSSAAFGYLVSLIIEDEKRHHRQFVDLADSLRTDAEMRPEQPTVPRLDLAGPDRGNIVALSEGLLERERADSKQLRQLAKEMSDVQDTTLWRLLVEIMELDTKKHIKILEFVRKHARR
jgi:hypothetical protein